MEKDNKGRRYKCKSYNLSEEGRLQKIKNLGDDIYNGITYCAEFHLKSKLHRGIQKTLRIGGQ